MQKYIFTLILVCKARTTTGTSGGTIERLLRYSLERPVIIRIGDHLDGFRMIRCLRSPQKLSRTLVETNKATSLRRKRKGVISEDLLNWQTCRGHSASPTFNLRRWRRGGKGHGILRDTPGSRFQNRRLRLTPLEPPNPSLY